MAVRSDKMSKFHPSSDDFLMEEFPFYWVAKVNSCYSVEMEKTLKLLNMDISRWRVAVLLHVHDEMSISDIAEHAFAKLPTITKIVYRMRDEGLVSVNVSESDGRVVIVSLTEKGEENIATVLEATQKLFKKAFKGFTEAQIKKTNLYLSRLFANLSDD